MSPKSNLQNVNSHKIKLPKHLKIEVDEKLLKEVLEHNKE